jgi:ParB-like chromosome segregation protein Spo0J
MQELGIEVLIPEISQDSLEEMVLITQTGLIVAGFRRWRLAVLQKVPSVNCVEHDLADADVLPFVLALKQQQ